MKGLPMLVGVCEDDPAIRRLLGEALRLTGHEVIFAHDGGEALRRLGRDSGVEVLVMDIGLPDSDGRDVCLALRSAGQPAPVLFLTALGETHDRLSGFGAGGDDYVAKPFEVKELIARLEALARRGRPADTGRTGLELDPARHAARTPHGEVLLTPTEFRMLAAITSLMPRSFRRQIVVLTVSATTFAMIVPTIVLQLVLHAQTQRDVDRVLADEADAVAGSLGERDGGTDGLSVPDEELSAGVAVFLADGTLVTVRGGTITGLQSLRLPSGGRSGDIAAWSSPILEREALAAQGARIQAVSGATYTSEGYAQSLQAALDEIAGQSGAGQSSAGQSSAGQTGSA